MGIHYLAGAPILPYGFFDASWAGDLDGRPSTSGYLFTLGSGPVSWCSKKQQVMGLSSIEAEYASVALVDKYLAQMRMILDQLGIPQEDTGNGITDWQFAFA